MKLNSLGKCTLFQDKYKGIAFTVHASASPGPVIRNNKKVKLQRLIAFHAMRVLVYGCPGEYFFFQPLTPHLQWGQF